MAQPFVLSMKFTADAAGATAATTAIRRDLGQLGAALDLSRSKADALNATLQAPRLSAVAINSGMGIRDDFDGAARQDDIAAYGRQMDELRARYNPLFAAEQRHQANLAEIRQANRLGAISALEMANAVRSEEAAFRQSVAGIDGSTEAMRRNLNVRASRPEGGGFATANIAAQFQDIAVTSAMGMSPLQIALQQGTQISAAFGPMGAAGAVRALGAAFMSIVSPVSLITIGLVAGGAAAIQYFAGLGSGADDASSKLDDHLARIEAMTLGYDQASQAARNFIERNSGAPQASVISDAQAALRDALVDVDDAMGSIIEKQSAISLDMLSWQSSRTLYADLIAASEGLDQLGLSADSSKAEINAVHTQLKDLANDPSTPAQIKQYADEFIVLIETLRAASIEAGSFQEIMNSLQMAPHLNFNAVMGNLRNVVPDMRDRFDVMRQNNENLLQQASMMAGSTGLLNASIEQYEENLRNIAKLEADDEARTSARAANRVSAFDQQIASLRERTAAQEVETSVVGLGTFASERARMVLDLENAARKDAIGLSAGRAMQIQQEASAYALATAAQENLIEAQQRSAEEYSFAQGTVRSFILDLNSGLREGENGWSAWGEAGANAFDTIADRAIAATAEGQWGPIFRGATQ